MLRIGSGRSTQKNLAAKKTEVIHTEKSGEVSKK